MPSYSVRCALARGGTQAGTPAPASLTFNTVEAIISLDPAPPINVDLAELVALEPSGGELRLALHSGLVLRLSGMGKMASELAVTLARARRDRTAYVFRFGKENSDQWEVGEVRGPDDSSAGRAGLRLFGSLLGMVPDQGEPRTIPFADIRAITFDEAAYEIVLETVPGCWRIGRLARRSSPFLDQLKRTRQEFTARYQAQLKDVMPHMEAESLQQLSSDWLEGVALPAASLDERSPGTAKRLCEFLPSEERRSFVEQLASCFGQAPSFGWYYSAEGVSDERPFEPFALFQKATAAGFAVAWEVLGEMGTATYIFRGSEKDLCEKVNASLRSIRFAREPIYLSAEELQTTGVYRHHVPLLARSDDLKFLKSRFVGRVLHSEPETYAERVRALCEGTA